VLGDFEFDAWHGVFLSLRGGLLVVVTY
jgi:hypothetical protein